MKALHTTTAVIEAGAGVVLLAAPSLAVRLLLAEEIPVAIVPLARLAGVALFTLGVACWLARNDSGSRAARGLATAMSVYNIGAVIVLGAAGIWSQPVGILLWPSVILHAAMTAWCLACFARR